MRQEEKQSAAAARELLKAEAMRERRGKSSQSRKAPSAAAMKRKSTGGAAAAPEQLISARVAVAPEQNGAPPMFFESSCFFNGAGNFFGGSPMSPPWMIPSDPATWDKNPTPPGGFTNLMQPHLSQNFHFTGGSSHFAPFKPPRAMQDSTEEQQISTPPSSNGNNQYVVVDSGDELPRTEKRILWTQEEDVKMMSSWLHNSTDPTMGADRKNEQYWYDVVETYNESTPNSRKRNAKQIKDRFHKVNRWTDLYHSAWVKARRIYTSGHNDQMWIDKAHVLYIEDNKDQKLGPFGLMDVWRAVRNEAKWITYNIGLKEARKKKGSVTGNEGKEAKDVENIDDDEFEDPGRPMGQKRAKKAALEKKKEPKDSDIEELDKFGKLQTEEHANRLKVLEVQQKLSTEKIEQAKLAHLAAKEQKEAAEKQREARKLELEAKMEMGAIWELVIREMEAIWELVIREMEVI
nr:unnamed protein product [Digitaria exilis]